MKSSKILAYIQILVMVCLTLCNDGIRVNSVRKSGEFPCKGHLCGCETESDCMAHCCCGLQKNQADFQNNGNEQKKSFQVFISSVNCKYENDPLSSVSCTAEYTLESQVQPIKESFLRFLSRDISISLLEAFISPPEKPPRRFV